MQTSGSRKAVVTPAVCGLPTEHEGSLEKQAEKEDIESNESWAMKS